MQAQPVVAMAEWPYPPPRSLSCAGGGAAGKRRGGAIRACQILLCLAINLYFSDESFIALLGGHDLRLKEIEMQ